MKDSRKFYNFVKGHLLRQNQEVFVVILLDVHGQVLGISEISRGARDRVLVPIPDILRLPLVDGATAFVVAHNHPSGKTKPSEADKEVTKSIKEGADAIGILFMDHIIVASDGYYSFNDHGLV
jgi:DNA repair protein RadC